MQKDGPYEMAVSEAEKEILDSLPLPQDMNLSKEEENYIFSRQHTPPGMGGLQNVFGDASFPDDSGLLYNQDFFDVGNSNLPNTSYFPETRATMRSMPAQSYTGSAPLQDYMPGQWAGSQGLGLSQMQYAQTNLQPSPSAQFGQIPSRIAPASGAQYTMHSKGPSSNYAFLPPQAQAQQHQNQQQRMRGAQYHTGQQTTRPMGLQHVPNQPSMVPRAGNAPAQNRQGYGFTESQLRMLKKQILIFKKLKRGERLVSGHSGGQPVQQDIPALNQPQDIAAYEEQHNAAPAPMSAAERQIASAQAAAQAQLAKAIAAGKSVTTKPEKPVKKVSEPKPFAKKIAPKPSIPVKAEVASPMHAQTPTAPQANFHSKQANVASAPKPVQTSNTSSASDHIVYLDASALKCVQLESPVNLKGTTAELKKAIKARPQPTLRWLGPLYNQTTKKHALATMHNHNSPLTPLQVNADISTMLQQERLHLVSRMCNRRISHLEKRLAKDRKLSWSGKAELRGQLRSLHLLSLQRKLRSAIEKEQVSIMSMGDGPYKKFLRASQKHKYEMLKQAEKAKAAKKRSFLDEVNKHRRSLLDLQYQAREQRSGRNRGILKQHDKLSRESMRKKVDDRNKRLEALKANDIDAYRQLLEQGAPGPTGEMRYKELQNFLSQTEEYLNKLAGKVSAVKLEQSRIEVAAKAEADALEEGMNEEDARRAGLRAAEKLVEDQVQQFNATASSNSNAQSRYYNLAHSVQEEVLRMPKLLKPPSNGKLRDYQFVGLQWMISLYNNKINGILADEMGLGKTVQVMALIAYLMEHKGNNGPHLIIVPNAVIVNWKAELIRWLPSVRCIYYVGSKDERARIFTESIQSVKFNVLVTSYEFVMRDAGRLSKIPWRYMIIDEAQRMKDRESKLSRTLDKFKVQRRLLLTGTPLQNDLGELWSLLNLLLPEVFDSRRSFDEWFGKSLSEKDEKKEKKNKEVDGEDGSGEDEDWLEMEKKIIIIHRLHQILEPFMLRRQVGDVERKLPAKIDVTLKSPLTVLQSAIYNWVQKTSALRINPAVPFKGRHHNRAYVSITNKAMELRKTCNHPHLVYPPHELNITESIIRKCGKMMMLDRILVKMKRTGHRVLLFSTMTRLLDVIEQYLRWRYVDGRLLAYQRIDGSTSLEKREEAIGEFNSPDSDTFIFLLSMRAAGRGLNLQSADTVIIYDPDPNPKNEEQAIARAHRIGQMKEVRVIHFESVVDDFTTSEHLDEEEQERGVQERHHALDESSKQIIRKKLTEADTRKYKDSVESIVRNVIQRQKNEMADEVINAGRFDGRTTQEERRQTLETMLQDEERNQTAKNEVPSIHEINRLLARSEEELRSFERIDLELDWCIPMKRSEVPRWMKFTQAMVDAAASSNAKSKPGLAGFIEDAHNRVQAMQAEGQTQSLDPVGRGARGFMRAKVEAEVAAVEQSRRDKLAAEKEARRKERENKRKEREEKRLEKEARRSAWNSLPSTTAWSADFERERTVSREDTVPMSEDSDGTDDLNVLEEEEDEYDEQTQANRVEDFDLNLAYSELADDDGTTAPVSEAGGGTSEETGVKRKRDDFRRSYSSFAEQNASPSGPPRVT